VGIRLETTTVFFERYGKIVLGVVVMLLFLLTAAFVFVVLLKNQVVERTKNLNEAKNELLASKEYLQTVLNSVGDAIFVHEADTGRIIDVNQRMCEMYGCTHDEAIQSSANDFSQGESPYSQSEALEWLRKAREIGPQTFEWLARHTNGQCFWVEATINFTVIGDNDRFVVIVHDLTERKKKMTEHENLQAMFSQAQKMETVGRLAGGVAHDFNNMLSVIFGYSELALKKIATDDPLHKDIEEVMAAARHAADITRQLLAFARKQTIAPQTLDISRAIEKILGMLRRLIGEDIDLAWLPDSNPYSMKRNPAFFIRRSKFSSTVSTRDKQYQLIFNFL